jgi:NAD+ synthase (glutamine-hydrolysing)
VSALRLGLLQFHPVVGDIQGNRDRISAMIHDAADRGAELAICGELALCGYPPQSLIVDEGMLREAQRALESLADDLPAGLVALIGAPHPTSDRRGVQNAAAVLTRGQVNGWADKQHLPTYAAFDEGRYFVPAHHSFVAELPKARVGVMICADLWEPEPSAACAAAGVDLLVALNASPYSPGMQRRRESTTIARALEHTVPVAYVNLVGGQDGLVFDGGSHLTDHAGAVVARGPALEEAVVICDVDLSWSRRSARSEPHRRAALRPAPGAVHVLPVQTGADPRVEPAGDGHPADGVAPWPGPEDHRWRAVLTALRDFTAGLRIDRVLVGLDGTLGAGLTALAAAEALGPDRVVLVDALPASVGADDDRRAWTDAVVSAGGWPSASHPALPTAGAAVAGGARGDAPAPSGGLPTDRGAAGNDAEHGIGGPRDAEGAMPIPLPLVHVAAPDPEAEPGDHSADALPLEQVVPDEDPAVRLIASRTTLLGLELAADAHEALLLSSADRTMRALGGGWPHELAGGFAPIGDLTRGWLVRIAWWLAAREEGAVVAPSAVLERAGETIGGPDPLHEPCATLDRVVEGYIDANHPTEVIVQREGLPTEMVLALADRIDRAELRRRSQPIAPRMSGRALSDDRRIPVVWRRGWP